MALRPIDDKTICYALGAVKGTGQGAIQAIVREREANGPFKSCFDFCSRVSRAGQQARGRSLADQGRGFRFAGATSRRPAGVHIAGLGCPPTRWRPTPTKAACSTSGTAMPRPPTSPIWCRPTMDAERATGAGEDHDGFYLSGHLFDEAESEVRRFARQRIGDLKEAAASPRCWPASSANYASSMAPAAGWSCSSSTTSETIEAVADQDTLDADKDLLKDD